MEVEAMQHLDTVREALVGLLADHDRLNVVCGYAREDAHVGLPQIEPAAQWSYGFVGEVHDVHGQGGSRLIEFGFSDGQKLTIKDEHIVGACFSNEELRVTYRDGLTVAVSA